MNSLLLLFTAVLAATPPGSAKAQVEKPTLTKFWAPYFEALQAPSEPLVIRGQSPGTVGSGLMGPILGPIQVDPQGQSSFYPPANGTGIQPLPIGTQVTPGQNFYNAQGTTDPFLPGGGTPFAPYSPYTGAKGSNFGLNGSQPYRYGWSARYDLAYMAPVGTSIPKGGKFSAITFDLEKDFVAPMPGGWTFSAAPQFNYRDWSGPYGNLGPSNLPANAYRFGLGLKIATPSVSGWSAEVGFNPALGTDFNIQLDRRALMLDGHAVAFWQMTPQFMVALGASYWERVDNIVLPYAGIVWNPNDYLELRLLFPKPRVSLFLGTPYGVPTWLYASGEYHVEAYEIAQGGAASQVQLADWRVLGGLRWEAGWFTTFLEAGYIFKRDVKFAPVGKDFTINDGFIARFGWRY